MRKLLILFALMVVPAWASAAPVVVPSARTASGDVAVVLPVISVDTTGAYVANGYTGPIAAQLPTTLGSTTSAASLSVTPASNATFTVGLPAGYSFAHISTAATTTVKSGAGVLHTLTVNNLGTVASVTTVYDNTAGSGTVIAIINTLAGQESYSYDVAFATGLTIVTTGTVAPDITVSYR